MTKEVFTEHVRAAMKQLGYPLLEPQTRGSAINVLLKMGVPNAVERTVWANQQTFTLEDIAYLAGLTFIVQQCNICGYELWHADGVSEEELERRVGDGRTVVGNRVLCGSCANKLAVRTERAAA